MCSADVCIQGMIDSRRLSDSMVLISLLYRVLRLIFAFGLRFVVACARAFECLFGIRDGRCVN